MTREECTAYAGLVKAWLDGELGEEEAARFDHHLASCAECRAVADDFRLISRRLRSAANLGGVPSPDPDAIRGRLRTIEADAREVIRYLRRVAALAAAVFFVAVLLLLFESKGSEGLNGELTRIRHDNVMEIVLSDLHWGEGF